LLEAAAVSVVVHAVSIGESHALGRCGAAGTGTAGVAVASGAAGSVRRGALLRIVLVLFLLGEEREGVGVSTLQVALLLAGQWLLL
jgi:hypothetical protein